MGKFIKTSINRRKNLKKKLRVKSNGGAAMETAVPMLTVPWKSGKSLHKNYEIMGLVSDPNAMLRREVEVEKSRVLGFEQEEALEILHKPDAHSSKTDAKEGELSSELEKIKKVEILPHIQTSMAIWEQLELRKLIARYKEDYEAMARDIKLNRYQKTAAQLERRVALYHQLQQQQ
jgi:hypothetical protein